jgi:hypothetical protein
MCVSKKKLIYNYAYKRIIRDSNHQTILKPGPTWPPSPKKRKISPLYFNMNTYLLYFSLQVSHTPLTSSRSIKTFFIKSNISKYIWFYEKKVWNSIIVVFISKLKFGLISINLDQFGYLLDRFWCQPPNTMN